MTLTWALIGLIEGLLLARDGGAPAIAAATALGVLGGVMWGVVQALLDRLARLPRRSLAALLRSADPGRGPIVRRHALALAAVLLAPGYILGLVLLVRRLEAIHEPTVVIGLVAGLGALGLAALVLGVLVLAGLLLGPVAALDRRVELPRPRSRPLRLLLYLVAPAALAAGAAIATIGAQLGPMALVPWFILYLSLETVLAIVVARVAPRLPARPRVLLRRFAVPTAVAAALAALAVVEPRPQVYDAVGRTRAPALARNLLRRLLDVDGDGFATVLGDRDCAAFDPAIGPLARDEPGNGVDEDCDGTDAVAARAARLEARSGALQPDQVRRYNVVLIIIDAVRADHTSLLGYQRETTPYLERLGERAVVFERAYSQSSATMLSIPSLLTGRDVGAIDWESHKGKLVSSPELPTLAERLGAAGYRTGIIATDYFPKNTPGVLRGYGHIRDVHQIFKEKPSQRRAAPVTTAAALEFLAPSLAGDRQPFFLTVYYGDPHAPYVEQKAGFPGFGRGDKSRYDQEIAAADRYSGILLETLRWSSLWDDTVVIVVADHGEEFGEHGNTKHSTTCHIESVHVPLVLRVPGLEARIDTPVGLVDVVPTVLELLGIDDGAALDGQSLLVPVLAPDRVDPQRPLFCSVLSQSASQSPFLRHGLRIGDEVVLHEALEDTFTIYDRAGDPGEAHPLDPGDPKVAARLAELSAVLRAHLTGDLATHRLNH